jgi:hypothetical protein
VGTLTEFGFRLVVCGEGGGGGGAGRRLLPGGGGGGSVSQQNVGSGLSVALWCYIRRGSIAP